MKDKKGFISMSLMYSFFIVFVALILALLVFYNNNRILVKKVQTEIKLSLPARCRIIDASGFCQG